MPTLRCLAIGISDAPPLTYLPGATNGARTFADWARSRGARTEILVDDAAPVGFAEFRAALLGLLPRGEKIDRLMIYFAGHGLARDAGEDLWLLSEWRADQRAVSVNGLVHKLGRYGLEQITIVGDACRTLPTGEDNAELTDDPVLGWGPYDRNDPSIDLLKASGRFQAAYVVGGGEPAKDRCIFSGVLDGALRGAEPEAFDPARGVITSDSLATYLKKAVPARAAEYKVELKPNLAMGFLTPDDVYVDARPAAPPILEAWPDSAEVVRQASGADAARFGGLRGWSTRGDRPAVAGAMPPVAASLRRDGPTDDVLKPMRAPPSGIDLAILASPAASSAAPSSRRAARRARAFRAGHPGEIPRPHAFATRAGLSVSGSRARCVSTGRHAGAQEEGRGWWQIVPGESEPGDFWRAGQLIAPVPVLVELESGNWTGAAALPGFIGTFTVADGLTDSLVFRRIGADGAAAEAAVSLLRAGALTPEAACDYAAILRDGGDVDPIRGALAAYLHDARADVESVRRTAFHFAGQGVPLPFDIALLGRLPCTRTPDGRILAEIPATRGRAPRSPRERTRPWTHEPTPAAGTVVAGAFPWFRQGWAMLDPEPGLPLAGPDIEALRAHLLPAPFTTLTPEGGRLLRRIMEGF